MTISNDDTRIENQRKTTTMFSNNVLPKSKSKSKSQSQSKSKRKSKE